MLLIFLHYSDQLKASTYANRVTASALLTFTAIVQFRKSSLLVQQALNVNTRTALSQECY
jgi:hypothetical protein